jgi:hypothetical protein
LSVREYVNRLWGLRTAFRRTFNGADGKLHSDGRMVLQELRRFCHGGKPTIKVGPSGVDAYASLAAAARQEVYFRVLDMLNLDDSDLALMERRVQQEQENSDG